MMLFFIIVCGLLAVGYGLLTSKLILSKDTGNEKMQEISFAIQEGAKAYLNRQYTTISIVGLIIFFIVWFALGFFAAIGFLVGSILSGVTGYVGMNISVRSNVRTTQASIKGLKEGLSVAFQAGAVTGMLVAGLALLSIAGYYYVLTNYFNFNGRELIEPLVSLGFGASLISIFCEIRWWNFY